MDIWLVYILKTLLLPQASLLVLAVIGTILAMRGRKSGLILVMFTQVVGYLLSTPIIAKTLAKPLEMTYAPLQIHQISAFNAQALVVLGGGLRSYAPEYEQQVAAATPTLERLRYAATLARATHLPMQVVGGKVLDEKLPSEAAVMAKTLWQDYGLKVRWQEASSRNTTENARNSYRSLSQQHITRIVLVTHALHMPRALEEFRRSGYEVLPAATGYIADADPLMVLDFLPSAKAFMISSMALHEYLGGVWYQLKSSAFNRVSFH